MTLFKFLMSSLPTSTTGLFYKNVRSPRIFSLLKMQVSGTRENLFDTVWYTLREPKPKLRKHGKGFIIEDKQVKNDFKTYVESKQTIQDFFKIDLIMVNLFK